MKTLSFVFSWLAFFLVLSVASLHSFIFVEDSETDGEPNGEGVYESSAILLFSSICVFFSIYARLTMVTGRIKQDDVRKRSVEASVEV